MNFSLHSYNFFQWSQSYPVDLKATAILKWQYFPTGCFSTYFHIPRGVCTWSGTLKWNWRPGKTCSIFILPYRIWNNSVQFLQKPIAFPSKVNSLSCCWLLSQNCHHSLSDVAMLGHWQSFLAWWCSYFSWQARLLKWKSHDSSGTLWELPCLSLLMSSNTILTSGYIPTPFEVSDVYSLTVDLSYLLIICWAIILSTICYFLFFLNSAVKGSV